MSQHLCGSHDFYEAITGRKTKIASNEKLIQLIKKQIGTENEHATHLTDLESKIDIVAAKLLLMKMRLDSQKHAGILEGILKVIGGKPPSRRRGITTPNATLINLQ